MDTSETYIKMCDCKEIEKNHNWAEGDYCVFRRDYIQGHWCIFRGQVILYASGGVDDIIDKVGGIFLPRQDQLQEMVDSPAIEWLIDKFWYWAREQHNVSPTLNTMERLWLAFVMKERYNKEWSGKEWK